MARHPRFPQHPHPSPAGCRTFCTRLSSEYRCVRSCPILLLERRGLPYRLLSGLLCCCRVNLLCCHHVNRPYCRHHLASLPCHSLFDRLCRDLAPSCTVTATFLPNFSHVKQKSLIDKFGWIRDGDDVTNVAIAK